MNCLIILTTEYIRPVRLGRFWPWALAALLVCLPAALPGAVTTITFAGTFVDRTNASGPISYHFEAGIQSAVNNFGNVLNYAGTVPASSQAGWMDPQGVPLQGDGRYADFRRSNGAFVLGATYALAPSRPAITTPLGSVHFTNGLADGAWLGRDASGITANTGIWGATQLAQQNPQRLKTIGDPIQLATGASTAERTLFSFYGARSWRFVISYNSVLAAGQGSPGAVGYGWSHSFEARVSTAGVNRLLQWNNTQQNTFVPKADTPGSFVSTEDAVRHDLLVTQPDGGWMLIRVDQSKLIFNAGGRLVEDRDPHGRKLLLAYDGSGRIATITDPVSATKLTFTYVFGTARIDTITDATGGVVSFGYTSGQLLNRIVNQDGKQVIFAYNANRALLTVTDHEGVVVSSNTYDADGRVVSQDDGVAGNQPLVMAYAEQGLPGYTLYAASDTNRTTPLPLPVPQRISITQFTSLDGRTINYAYGPDGLLNSATVGGQTTTVNYDAAGSVVSVTDPAGQTSPVTPGITVTATDRIGRPVVYQFDPALNLVALEDALHQRTRYTYDVQNNLTTITDPLNRVTTFAYDSAGNLLTVTDPAGFVTTRAYDSRNNLVATTDSAGQVTTRTYDASNNLIALTDAQGATTAWTYDANSLPLSQTLPRGGVYHYAYTAGRLSEVTDPAGVITRYGYDANGRMLYQEDGLGHRTTFTYDAIGNQLAVTNPLNQTTTSSYDHRNRLRSVTDASGATTAFVYDLNGNLASSTDALGHVTTYAYDGEDRLTSITDASGRVTTRGYDSMGRVIAATARTGGPETFEYDAAGQQTAVIDALGQRTVNHYDSRGRLQDWADPLGRGTGYDHDALGQRTGMHDALGRMTRWERDALGRLVRATEQSGITTAQDYDTDGNLVALANPLAQVTTLSRDPAGRLTAIRTPEGRETVYSYDGQGRLASVVTPTGRTTTYTYDAAGRLSSVTDPAGTVSYGRDVEGRVLTVTEGGQVLRRAYDAIGRLISCTDADGNVIGYAYDGAGRISQLTYPDGRQVGYGYDPAGRLLTVTDWAGRVTTYVYDAVGRVTELRRPNGTKQVRRYDAAGQLTELKEYKPDGATTFYVAIYEYNALGQLTREDVVPAIDAPVAPVMQTFDRDNRLLSHNGAAIDLDADGNLRSIAAGVTPASYSFDARNRLTDAGDVRYVYDAENRRIASVGTSGTTRWIVNPHASPDQVLVRTRPDGTRTCYVYGLGLLEEETGAVVRYYHADRRGDTVALTDASGAVTDQMGYGAYGELVARNGSSDTPFLFNGHWGVQTDGNGLYYLRARYYHPALRRFLSEDGILGCIERPGTLNRFAYTGGDPLGRVDPAGRYDRDVHHDLTFALAVRVGFTQEEAEEIAAADQALDDQWLTGPFLNATARRRFHFATPERREDMLQQAMDAQDLEMFGRYLHAEQDSYAHQRGLMDRDGEPYGPVFGHVFAGFEPDRTDARPELADRMAERTYQQLRSFFDQTHTQKSCDDWANILPVMDHWARIEK